MSGQPNILFVLTDSSRADVMGCYGNDLVRTPNADRLAAEGVRFTQAYTVSPICHPARASIATGLFLHGHGVLTNVITKGTYPYRLFPGAPKMQTVLSGAGYLCGYSGQSHKPLGDGWTETRNGMAEQGEWLKEKGLTEFSEEIVERLYGELPYGAEHTRDAFNARGAVDLIKRFSREGRPWFVHCDLDAPHPPIGVAPEFAGLYKPEDIPRPENFDDPLENKPEVQRIIRRRAFGENGPSWEHISEMQSYYYAYVTQTDHYLGWLLDALEETGQAADTMVVFSSDHGEHIGAHGMLFKAQTMYDELMRVPLIVRWSAMRREAGDFDGFVSHVDLVPTFAQAAGISAPEPIHGASWLDAVTGEGEYAKRDSIYGQYCGTGPSYYTLRMVRTRAFKYVYSHYALNELYDLERDPGEIVNLAGDAQSADAMREMHERLIAWARETGDPIACELPPP